MGRARGFVGAYQSIAWFYAARTGQISIRHGMKGPCGVVVAEGAGGLDALRMPAGRSGAASTSSSPAASRHRSAPYALTCQMASGHLSAARDPALAYRPFDAGANG